MPADRPIAPTPSRIAKAHAAGLRPPARWLATGACALALGALASRFDPVALGTSLRLGDPGASPRDAIVSGLSGWAALVVTALLGIGVARIAAGSLGGVDRRARRGLSLPGPVREGGLASAAASMVALCVVAMMLAGVVAGAVRATDAPAAALSTVWWTWLVRALLVGGGGCVLAGLVELASWRSARWRALHLSVEDARRQAREHSRKAAG